jgi:bifunctional ADP-heptose synthase (sugar kinase/adenylyltransferase)
MATPEGSLHVPGMSVAAVDATGAGDAFTGALLSERARGRPLGEAVRFANAAAALSTLGYGAIAPLPLPTRESELAALAQATAEAAGRRGFADGVLVGEVALLELTATRVHELAPASNAPPTASCASCSSRCAGRAWRSTRCLWA